MRIGIADTPYKRFGDDRYKFMREDGYTDCDFQGFVNTETALFQCSLPEYEKALSEEKKRADEYGIQFNQVHSPWRFPPRDETEEDREERLEKMKKTIYGSSLLGSKYFVVHPIMPFGCETNPEPKRFWDMNIRFFLKLLPEAKKDGVIICLENMPFLKLSLSTPSQILKFVKEIKDDNFKFCLDTGHSEIWKIPSHEAVLEAGKELRTLHVHDNNGRNDLHAMPFTGIIDFESFVKALSTVGYDGVLSLETTTYHKMPLEIYREYLKLNARSARYLADLCK